MAEHEIHMRVQFSESHPESETRQNIASNDTLPTIAHKIHRMFDDIESGHISGGVKESDIVDTSIDITTNAAVSYNTVGNIATKSISGLTGHRVISVRVSQCDDEVYIKSIDVASSNPTSISVTFEANGSLAADSNFCTIILTTIKVS